MKIAELLNEGMYVVKSKDGVEKRFKDANSAEAKAWKDSTQKKTVTKFPKYGKVYWSRKADDYNYDGKLPWSKIDSMEVGDQFEKIAKEQGFGRVEDFHVTKRDEMNVDGVTVATVSVRMVFSFGKEDDLGLDVEGDERVSDSQYIKLRRDTKHPEKLVFAGYQG